MRALSEAGGNAVGDRADAFVCKSAIGVLNGIRVRSAGQRRHHQGRRSPIGALLSLLWVFWSLRASAARRTCSRQASRSKGGWPLAAACWFTPPNLRADD
jgi:hypothetical protein